MSLIYMESLAENNNHSMLHKRQLRHRWLITECVIWKSLDIQALNRRDQLQYADQATSNFKPQFSLISEQEAFIKYVAVLTFGNKSNMKKC